MEMERWKNGRKVFYYEFVQKDGHDCMPNLVVQEDRCVSEDMVLLAKEICSVCGRVYYSEWHRYRLYTGEQKKETGLPLSKLD